MSPTILGIVLVVLCTIFEAIGQVFLKKSVLEVARRRFWIGLGICFLILEVLMYSGALRFLALSVAFTVSSLNFVTITLLSMWLLRERVTRTRWIGVVLILLGTGLIVAYA
ncbi:MAG TPA: SMR family transporter [Xanthobacteraceae bacterium]|jgi:undecaprenyl phosphate-alpha-L-ara4N flippase subunit ArnE|nr:SMR family transporter [Xanthobacteraceae bacterium]